MALDIYFSVLLYRVGDWLRSVTYVIISVATVYLRRTIDVLEKRKDTDLSVVHSWASKPDSRVLSKSVKKSKWNIKKYYKKTAKYLKLTSIPSRVSLFFAKPAVNMAMQKKMYVPYGTPLRKLLFSGDTYRYPCNLSN